MTKNTDDIRVTLSIFDFEYSPEQLTKDIGLQPTDVWTKGEKRDVGNGHLVPNTQNVWRHSSTLPRHTPVEEQLTHLLDKLKPHAAKIAQLSANHDATITCTMLMYSDRPAMFFEKDIVSQLAELNVNLDFDIYDFQPKED